MAQPYLVRKLSEQISQTRSMSEWVRFAARYQTKIGRGRLSLKLSLRADQIPAEITRLLELVSREQPQRILEIGSAGGGTLFLFARAAAEDALLIGLDLPPYPGGGLPSWRAALYERAFGSPRQRVKMIRGDSHSETTKSRVVDVLEGSHVDFLFVDGDHSYEGVRRDFELYSTLVRPGGIIALHDIVPDLFHRTGVRTSSDSGEVFRFWAELKERYLHYKSPLELIEDATQDGLGIGVLRV